MPSKLGGGGSWGQSSWAGDGDNDDADDAVVVGWGVGEEGEVKAAVGKLHSCSPQPALVLVALTHDDDDDVAM